MNKSSLILDIVFIPLSVMFAFFGITCFMFLVPGLMSDIIPGLMAFIGVVCMFMASIIFFNISPTGHKILLDIKG